MVHRIYRPWMSSQRPILMNRNIIIDQRSHCHHTGNGGFWGAFLGGFLGGGLLNSGFLGNIFGIGTGMGGMQGGLYGGGAYPSTIPGATNSYGYLNQNAGSAPATQSTTKDLSVLQKFYGDSYIIEELDGKFYAKDKDGNSVIEGNDFQDMLDKLGGKEPASENPETQNLNEIKQAAQRQGQLIKAKEEAQKFMTTKGVIASGAKISVIEDGENFAQYKLTLKDGTTKIVRDIPTAYKELGIDPANADNTPEIETEPPKAETPATATPAATAHAATKPKTSFKGWERIATSDRNETVGYGGNYQIDGKAQAYNQNDIENAKSAQEVARYMLLTEMGLPAPIDASEDLINEIIQHNPSVFNKDGSVKENADWTKLDLPTAEYLKQKGYPIKEKAT